MRRWYQRAAALAVTTALTAAISFGATTLRAEDTGKDVDDLYVEVYNTIQGADEAWQMGKKRDAYNLYQRAHGFLENIKKEHPDWNQKLIDFRLSYVNSKLEQFTKDSVQPTQEPQVYTNTTSDAAQEIQRLRTQLAQSEEICKNLEAKLREAVAAQPATVDPKQLENAEKIIAELTQANASLKAQVAQLTVPEEKLSSHEIKQLDKANNTIAKLETELSVLKLENIDLKRNIKDVTSQSDNAQVKAASESVSRLEKQLADIQAANKSLQDKLTELQSALEGKTKDFSSKLAEQEKVIAELNDTLAKVKAENETLKGASGTTAKTTQDAQLAASEAQKQLDTANEELSQLRSNTRQLEEDLATTQQALTSAMSDDGSIKELKSKVSELEKTVDGLNEENRVLRDAASRKGAKKVINDMDRLRARIAVYERNKEPYTPEELALMRPGKSIRVGNTLDTQITLSTSGSVGGSGIKSSTHSAPAEGHEIAAEGIREFGAGHMAEAERLFQRLLSLDENSVYTLGNLGAAQLELNKLQEAEINLKKAHSLDPQDTYVMNLLAILNLKNQKIDYAFELLSTSAKIDPSNPETQNYLGMVLGERGLRTDAEKAFRAAVKLSPNYPVAHYNLAVLYATTKPAYPQLANYHYRKALSLGATANPEFEKMLQEAMRDNLSTNTTTNVETKESTTPVVPAVPVENTKTNTEK